MYGNSKVNTAFSGFFYLMGIFIYACLVIFALGCSGDKAANETLEKPLIQADSQHVVINNQPELKIADSLYSQAKASIEQRLFEGVEEELKQAGSIYERIAIENNNLTIWEKYYNCQRLLAEYYRFIRKLDLAFQTLEQHLQPAEEKLGKQNEIVANFYFSYGNILLIVGQLDEALKYFDTSLKIWSQLPSPDYATLTKIQHNYTQCYFYKGNYLRAIEEYQKAADFASKPEAVFADSSIFFNIYNGIAGAYYSLGDYDNSFKFLKKAADIQDDSWENQSFLYYNRAIHLYEQGDYESALDLNQQALNLRIHNFPTDIHSDIANNFNLRGAIYFDLEDYEQALSDYQKYIDIHLKLSPRNYILIAIGYENIGTALARLGQNDKALKNFEESLEIRKKFFPDGHPDMAADYINIGNVYAAKQLHSRALANYQKSLDISFSTGAERQPAVSQAYRSIGDVYFQLKDFSKVLSYYQQSIIAVTKDFTDLSPTANPDPGKIIWKKEGLSSLIAKANALAAQFNLNGNITSLHNALETYEQAAKLIERMRIDYRSEGSKLFLARNAKTLYEKAIHTSLDLYRATAKPAYLEEALRFSEKAKAGVLMDAIRETRIRHFAGIPDILLNEEEELRLHLTRFENQWLLETIKSSPEQDSLLIEETEDSLLALKLRYDNLIASFKSNPEYSEYHRLIHQFPEVSIDQLRNVIDEQTLLIEYFLGNDSIYIFTLSQNDFKVTAIKNDPALEKTVKLFRNVVVGNSSYPDYVKTSSRLYEYLIKPLEKDFAGKQLIIIPDGLLNALPFEMLLTEAVPEHPEFYDYRKLPYLIKTSTVSYAYSLPLLLDALSEKHPQPGKDFIAYAPVFRNGLSDSSGIMAFLDRPGAGDSTRGTGASLLYSEEEVKEIDRAFNRGYNWVTRINNFLFNSKTRLRLENEATEENLKAEALYDYRYVHFSTHGFLYENNPKLSGLLFFSPAKDPEEGVLFLGEIYNLRLNADLLVLSACETGLGKYYKGEGLIGLTRGFIYAGARNLVVSLWQVRDHSTAQLMVDFYRKMLQTHDKAKALQAAKLKMIEESEEFAHPYHWAPFILIGK